MKLNKKIINYYLVTVVLFVMTACGGGSKDSISCSKITDSDSDGFHDEIDVAPQEPFQNGNFSTPEKIINHPKIQRIIQIAKDHGITVRTDLEHNPPNLTGYYKAESGGIIVDAQRADQIGRSFVAKENRICAKKDYIETTNAAYSGGYFTKGIKIRGNGKYFTTYNLNSFNSSGCINYNVIIKSGKVNESGDITNIQRLKIILDYVEKSNGACPYIEHYWSVSSFVPEKKVTDLDELEYMCVDGKKAYVPGETWKNRDKESCTCTKDVEIECS